MPDILGVKPTYIIKLQYFMAPKLTVDADDFSESCKIVIEKPGRVGWNQKLAKCYRS